MPETSIKIICPGCMHVFYATPDEQGQVVDCPECQGYVDVPELARKPTQHEINEDERYRRAQETWERQAAKTEELQSLDVRNVELQTENAKRTAKALDRLDAVISRWEQLADRMAGVIDKIDRPSG